MQCISGQIRVVAPGRYKLITLPVIEGLLATAEERTGKRELSTAEQCNIHTPVRT
jgi:hypothetical protein